MISSRQKAIIVGGLMSGKIIIKNELDILFPQMGRTSTWMSHEMDSIPDGDEDLVKFLTTANSCFNGDDSNIIIEWFNKMSPLAIATWFASSHTLEGGFLTHNKLKHGHVINSMLRRWGIKLVSEDKHLFPASENDEINLHLLIKKHLTLINPALISCTPARYRRNFKTVYLSGGQQHATDGGVNWRALISPRLFRKGFDIENPVYDEGCVSDIYGVNLNQLKKDNFQEYMNAGTALIELDYSVVARSNVSLVYWDEAAEKGAGTKSEITWCRDMNIPVVVVLAVGYTKEDLPLWTLGGIREEKHVIEDSDFDEAVRLINDKYGDRSI